MNSLAGLGWNLLSDHSTRLRSGKRLLDRARNSVLESDATSSLYRLYWSLGNTHGDGSRFDECLSLRLRRRLLLLLLNLNVRTGLTRIRIRWSLTRLLLICLLLTRLLLVCMLTRLLLRRPCILKLIQSCVDLCFLRCRHCLILIAHVLRHVCNFLPMGNARGRRSRNLLIGGRW